MPTAKVFVGSLPSGCKPDELRRLFANYGVVEADVMNRCGFVHLETSDMADAAISALNGTLFKGVSIVVEAGRPKERSRNGAGSRVPPSVGGGSGRRSLEGQSGASNHRRDGGGSAGGRYGSDGGFKSNGNQFGPIRNETNFRQQRNAPYSKGPPQQTSNESPQGYRNKFSVGSNGGRNGDGGRFSSNRFQHRDNNDGAGSSSANRAAPQGPRRNIKNSPSNNNNDFLAGNSSFNNPRGGTGVRQDRRGFALPVEQQQMTFGVQQNRFRNGSSSGNRNSSGVNGADPQGRRSSYNERGGFNARRGAANHEHNRPQRPGGASNKPGAVDRPDQSGLHASYQTEFPPLGRQEGGRGGGAVHRNRFNGPRPGPNNMGGNRRF